MSKIFLDILNISIAAGWLIAAVIAVRFLLKKHVPKWTLCLLWAVVGIRLLLPLSFESDLSLLPSGKTVNTETVITSPHYEHSENENIENHTPVYNYESINTNNYIDSGIKTIDDRINTAINEVVIQKPEENSIPLITDVASMIWILGIVGMTVYAVINYILLKRLIAVFLPVDKHIRKSENVGSPFILGVFMPKIYIPFGLEQSTENHVIAHEKAHIKRLDHLIKPLGFIMLTVHWFNPLVWIAYILLCRDIEMACDEKVVKNMSEDARKSYASALLECGIKRSYITACPIAFGEVGVKQRVKNALTYKKPIFWVIIAAVIVCISLSVFFLTNPKDDSDIPQNTDQSEDNSQITDNNEKLIDFEEYYFDAYLTEYKCNTFPDPMTTFTAETKEEFTRICSYTGDERFLKFAEELPENYFETKMFIFAYSWLNPSAIIDVTDIVAKGDTVTMNVTYENILENENIYTRLIVVSVEKEVAGSYENYVTKHISLAEAYVPKSENKISFTQHIFGGTYNYSSFSTPGISKAIKIGSDADFEEFLKEYEYSENHSGTDMRAFAASLPDDYFETKALIIIPAELHICDGYKTPKIAAVYSDSDYLMVCASIDSKIIFSSGYNPNIFVAQVNKTDIRTNAKVRCRISYYKEPYYDESDESENKIPEGIDQADLETYRDILSTYYLMDKYLFAADYEEYHNNIQNPIFDCPNYDEDLEYEWGSMIADSTTTKYYVENTEFGYAFKDINGDGINELLLLEKDIMIRAIFTAVNGKVKLLDAFWSRYNGILLENGDIYTSGSSGASVTDYAIRRLIDGKLETIKQFGIDMDDNGEEYYYKVVDNDFTIINKDAFDEIISSYPDFPAFGKFFDDDNKDGIMKLSDLYQPIKSMPLPKPSL